MWDITTEQPFLSPQIRCRASFRRLFQLGLFNLFEFAFASNCLRVKQAGTDILLMALEDSSGSIRTHIVEQAKDKSDKAFFDGIINQFLTENDANLMPQLTEIIRVLVDIDPESADDNGLGLPVGAPFSVVISSRLDPDADRFLDLFYTQYCSMLVAPVLQLMRSMFLIQTRLCHVVDGAGAEVEGRFLYARTG